MKKYRSFFKKKTIIVTGHTGFKGSWLCAILLIFGAKIIGISSYDLGKNSIYRIIKLKSKLYKDYKVDINNFKKIKSIILKHQPDIIFHLAAQSLVSKSVDNPLETLNTNIIGTANVLESLRYIKKKCIGIIITSDKCYFNKETNKGYKEEDILGGIDPYSASKTSAEIIYKSYFKTYFATKKNILLASARAGNVIGGGDFSENRIIPDVIRSLINNKKLNIRNPKSTRPWQHVLEPLRGYITLSINLYYQHIKSGDSFNFGPGKKENYNVIEVVNIIKKLAPNLKIKMNKSRLSFKESGLLKLNCSKANKTIGWYPYLNTKQSIYLTMQWYLDFINKKGIEDLTFKQISDYYEK